MYVTPVAPLQATSSPPSRAPHPDRVAIGLDGGTGEHGSVD